MAQSPQSNVYRLLIRRALALERDRFAESEAAYQTAVLLRTADPEMHMVVISMRNQGASWRTILTHFMPSGWTSWSRKCVRKCADDPKRLPPFGDRCFGFHRRGRLPWTA